MTRFDECLPFILQWEGGFVDNPLDRGGATNKGITQDTYDAYRVNNKRSVAAIEDREVRDIYSAFYWLPAKCAILPDPADLVVFDSAVNHGVVKSAKLLQQAVGVVVDGHVGTETMDAVKEMEPLELADAIIEERQRFYRRIVQNDPTQQVFLKGWLNRLHALETAINMGDD